MSTERRKTKRIKEDFALICKIFRKTSEENDLTHIIDFNSTGLCFISDGELDQNVILQLIFRIPPDFKQKIEVFGRVVNSQIEENNKFKTNVVFIDINEETKAILNRCIEQANR